MRTIERIAQSEDANERAALGGSLVVAQEELKQTTNLIEEITTAPIQTGSELSANEDSSFNLYDNIQLDLINVELLPAEATYSVLRRFSIAINLAELIRQTIRTLLRCNKTAQMYGAPEVFKQTAQATEAMVALPGIVVRSENDLRDYVTFFYGHLRRRRRPEIKISQRKRRMFGTNRMRRDLEPKSSPQQVAYARPGTRQTKRHSLVLVRNKEIFP